MCGVGLIRAARPPWLLHELVCSTDRIHGLRERAHFMNGVKLRRVCVIIETIVLQSA